VAYTADRYPIKRKNFAELNQNDVDKFRNILDEHRIVTGESEMEGNPQRRMLVPLFALCGFVSTMPCKSIFKKGKG
jgi:hypothetical protein